MQSPLTAIGHPTIPGTQPADLRIGNSVNKPIPLGAGPGFGFDNLFSSSLSRSQIMKPTGKLDTPLGGVKGPLLQTAPKATASKLTSAPKAIGSGVVSSPTGINTKKAIHLFLRELLVKQAEGPDSGPLGDVKAALPLNADAPKPGASAPAITPAKLPTFEPGRKWSDGPDYDQSPQLRPGYLGPKLPPVTPTANNPFNSMNAVNQRRSELELPPIAGRTTSELTPREYRDQLRQQQDYDRYDRTKPMMMNHGLQSTFLGATGRDIRNTTPLEAGGVLAAGPLFRGLGAAGSWGLSKLFPALAGRAAVPAVGVAGAAAASSAAAPTASSAVSAAGAGGLLSRLAQGAKSRFNPAELGSRVPFSTSNPHLAASLTAAPFSPLTTGLNALRSIGGTGALPWLGRAGVNVLQKATAIPRYVSGEASAAGLAQATTGTRAGVLQGMAGYAAPFAALSLTRPDDLIPDKDGQMRNPFLDQKTTGIAGASAAIQSKDPTKLLSVPANRFVDTSDRMLDRWLRPTEQKFTELRGQGRSPLVAGAEAAYNTALNTAKLTQTGLANLINREGQTTANRAAKAVNEELKRQQGATSRAKLDQFDPARFAGSPIYDQVKGLVHGDLGTPEQQATAAMQKQLDRRAEDYEDKILRGEYAAAELQKDTIQDWIKLNQPKSVEGGLKINDPTKTLIPLSGRDFAAALPGVAEGELDKATSAMIDSGTPPGAVPVSARMMQTRQAYVEATAKAKADPTNQELKGQAEQARLEASRALRAYNDRSLAVYEQKVLPKILPEATKLAPDLVKAQETLKAAQQAGSIASPEQAQAIEQAKLTIAKGAKLAESVQGYAIRKAGQIDPNIKTVTDLTKSFDNVEVVRDVRGNPVMSQYTDEQGNPIPVVRPVGDNAKALHDVTQQQLIKELGAVPPAAVSAVTSVMNPMEKMLVYGGLGLVATAILSGALGGGQLGLVLGALGATGLGAVAGGALSSGGFSFNKLFDPQRWKSLFGGAMAGITGQKAPAAPELPPGYLDVEAVKGTPEFKAAVTGKLPRDQAIAVFSRIRPDQRQQVLDQITDKGQQAFFRQVTGMPEGGAASPTGQPTVEPSAQLGMSPESFARGRAKLLDPATASDPMTAMSDPNVSTIISSMAKMDPNTLGDFVNRNIPAATAKSFDAAVGKYAGNPAMLAVAAQSLGVTPEQLKTLMATMKARSQAVN